MFRFFIKSDPLYYSGLRFFHLFIFSFFLRRRIEQFKMYFLSVGLPFIFIPKVKVIVRSFLPFLGNRKQENYVSFLWSESQSVWNHRVRGSISPLHRVTLVHLESLCRWHINGPPPLRSRSSRKSPLLMEVSRHLQSSLTGTWRGSQSEPSVHGVTLIEGSLEYPRL